MVSVEFQLMETKELAQNEPEKVSLHSKTILELLMKISLYAKLTPTFENGAEIRESELRGLPGCKLGLGMTVRSPLSTEHAPLYMPIIVEYCEVLTAKQFSAKLNAQARLICRCKLVRDLLVIQTS